jgi:hypothetical protein
VFDITLKPPAAAPGPPELEPDLQDVLQVEAPLSAMPVRVEGPVRFQHLPTKERSAKTATVGSSAFVQLLAADPYRAFATVEAFDQDVYLSYSPATSYGDPNVQRLRKGATYTITARTYVGIAAVTATTVISMAQERLANAE